MISEILLGKALLNFIELATEESIIKPALRKALSPMTKFLTNEFDEKKADIEIQSAFGTVIEKRWPEDKKLDDVNNLTEYIRKLGLSTLLSDTNEELRAQFAIELIYFTNGSTPSETLRNLLKWPDSQIDELSLLLTDLRESLTKINNSEWWQMLSYANDMHIHEKLKKLDEVHEMIKEMYAERNIMSGNNTVAQHHIKGSQPNNKIAKSRDHTELLLQNYRNNKMDLRLKLSAIVDERNISLDDKRTMEQLNKKITQLEKELSNLDKLV